MLYYSIIYFFSSIIWLFIFRIINKKLKISTIFITFSAGILAAIFAGYLSHFLQSILLSGPRNSYSFILPDFFLFFFIVGPVEELSKFLAVLLTSLHRKEFNTSVDGIILAISASLGFAAIENVLYLWAFGLELTIPRLILFNLGHCAYSIFWGYSLAVVLNEGAPSSLLLTGLLIAAIFHGAYNYFLTLSLLGTIAAFLLSLILFIFMFKFLKTETKRNR